MERQIQAEGYDVSEVREIIEESAQVRVGSRSRTGIVLLWDFGALSAA